ncbi:MAG: hypothetical protein ACOCW9_01075 [Thermodesulfobacteriota bacterium]
MMNASRSTLAIHSDEIPSISPLFQKGVLVEVDTGYSVKSLLCDQWGIPLDYVAERISTLFLNGQPVDDIDTAKIHEGAVLALSSAMPGLVGAMMRRGGIITPLRSSITYREQGAGLDRKRGRITVKLFNLLVNELGPRLLEIGFRAEAGDLKALFPERVDAALEDGELIRVVSHADPSASSD